MKVFLGGTCSNSTWRSELIPKLVAEGIAFFNPVVEDWTPECQAEEYDQKDNECGAHLYVITKEMLGVFSIAEAVLSACSKGKVCLFQVVPDGFDEVQIKSFVAVAELITKARGFAYVGPGLDWIPIKLKEIGRTTKF